MVVDLRDLRVTNAVSCPFKRPRRRYVISEGDMMRAMLIHAGRSIRFESSGLDDFTYYGTRMRYDGPPLVRETDALPL